MPTPLFRQATPADVDRCYEIETLAYEGDEAATRKRLLPVSSAIRRDLCAWS